ncbi:hypothetical protein M1N24_02895, partial [Dehalococcoidia bacterium]|nr:hypothetical protein [Dehalococcoidia bacterium]
KPNTTTIDDSNDNSYLGNSETEGGLAPDPLLARLVFSQLSSDSHAKYLTTLHRPPKFGDSGSLPVVEFKADRFTVILIIAVC